MKEKGIYKVGLIYLVITTCVIKKRTKGLKNSDKGLRPYKSGRKRGPTQYKQEVLGGIVGKGHFFSPAFFPVFFGR